MTDNRAAIGSWVLPSGNSVDVFLRHERPGLEHVDFEWDDPPPLPPADEVFYFGTILPEVHRRIAELQERPVGRGLYIRTRPVS